MNEEKPTSPNLGRYVAILTPLIGAPLAGYVAAVVANIAPGIDIPDKGTSGAVAHAAVFIVGALIALAKSLAWQKGWRTYEQDTRLLGAGVTPPAAGAIDTSGGPGDEGDGGGGWDGGDGGDGGDGDLGGPEPWEEPDLEPAGAGETTARWSVPVNPEQFGEGPPPGIENPSPGMQIPTFGGQPGPA